MTSAMQLPRLPEYLLSFWRLQKDDAWQAQKRKDLKGWKTSSLAEAYIKHQLENHDRVKQSQEQPKQVALTLSSLAAGKVLDVLSTSDNFEADLKTTAKSLNSTTVRQLLTDPRTPYLVLRALHNFLQAHTAGKTTDERRGIVDTDEAIQANERYIQSRGEANRDGKYLVGLKELSSILLESPDSTTDGAQMTFVRRDPPKGGLEILDAFRERVMHIQPNDASFLRTFERISKGALDGLDWSNVFIAGGMALTTLMHIDSTKDDERSVKDCDIDLYIYDLTPEEANRKVEDIYNVWSNNLPSTNRQKLVVKNAKTINLLPSYPNRRIQIILKLLPSPTQILLNFDLDACAIGFDGSRVLMLPRFARAMETGYSVFTMDLVWGHHLGNRRATQEKRVFKYADRGFGLRFLPSYARSLEEDNLEQTFGKAPPDHHDRALAGGFTFDEETAQVEMDYPPLIITQPERNRKPDGPEPGLKTLKRIAYLGQDFVNRFYFGVTPLAVPHPLDAHMLGGMETDGFVRGQIDAFNEEEFKSIFSKIQGTNKAIREVDEVQRLRYTAQYGPFISFTVLDTNDMHGDLPDGRQGVGSFELFMRHCEAWRLHARADATLDMTRFASLAYDPESYDDLPSYLWNEDLDLDSFAREIVSGNDELFGSLEFALSDRLGIDLRRSGYSGYLPRRIRRQVHGPDLASVRKKQIALPLTIPWDLENFLLTNIPTQYPDFPRHATAFEPLIPIYDSAKQDPATVALLSSQETVAESGNLRYWVITNESMWAGQHRALDEIAEVYWVLFHLFNKVTRTILVGVEDGVVRTDTEQCIWQLARFFRRRLVLPGFPTDDGAQENQLKMPAGLPTLRESLLFRPWAFYTPRVPNRSFVELNNDEDTPHPLFDDERVLYPFPDSLFWKDGDEGVWDGDGVPLWRDVGKDTKAREGVRRRPLTDEEMKSTEEAVAMHNRTRQDLQMVRGDDGNSMEGSWMEEDRSMEEGNSRDGESAMKDGSSAEDEGSTEEH